MVKCDEMLKMTIRELDQIDRSRRATILTCVGGSVALLAGGGAAGASYLMTASNAAKICQLAAKTLGLTGLSSVVIATLVAYISLDQSEVRQEHFVDKLSSVAARMNQVVQKNQIQIQGHTIAAHLQLSASQQNKIATLEEQMARVLNLIEAPAPV